MSQLPSIILCIGASALGYMFLTKSNDENVDTNLDENMELFDPKTEITDDSYKQAISEARKNKQLLFIDVYAPWCGWCKKMAGEWNKLGEEYEDNSDVTILTIDGSSNENAKDHFAVKTFPKLVLYNGKTNKYHNYKGERTVDEFKKFINKRL
jgi:protein disulfide-isomerase-like protein